MNLFTATMVAASILSATANVGSNYIYNVKNENNAVVEQTVYKIDESKRYLTNHIKYDFSYDNESRLTKKTTLRWNQKTEKWENSSQLVYSYSDDNCTIEYARWDNKKNDFSDVSEKVSYTYNKMDQITGYQALKMNEKTNEWYVVMNHEINILQSDFYWLAQNN